MEKHDCPVSKALDGDGNGLYLTCVCCHREGVFSQKILFAVVAIEIRYRSPKEGLN